MGAMSSDDTLHRSQLPFHGVQSAFGRRLGVDRRMKPNRNLRISLVVQWSGRCF